MEPEILAYYDLGAEAERLAAGAGVLELLRTQDILRRVLPSPPGRVLDVGGGTGVYAGWLAGLYFTTAYFHRPEELTAELTDAGLAVGSILSVEGVAGWLVDRIEAWLADPATRDRVLGPLRAVEAEPSLLGASSHILAVGHNLAS
ncbi:MAG TPA: hypothetical protein VGJ63_10325 [Micromonosporaceae bacterium]|jgi:hypothetical protein